MIAMLSVIFCTASSYSVIAQDAVEDVEAVAREVQAQIDAVWRVETEREVWEPGQPQTRNHPAVNQAWLARLRIDEILIPRVERALYEGFLDALAVTDDQRMICTAIFEEYESAISAPILNTYDSQSLESVEDRVMSRAWATLDEEFALLVDTTGTVLTEPQCALLPAAKRILRRQVMLQRFRVFPGYLRFHYNGDDLDLAIVLDEFMKRDLCGEDFATVQEELTQISEQYAIDLDSHLNWLSHVFRQARFDHFIAERDADEDGLRTAWAADKRRRVVVDSILDRYGRMIEGKLQEGGFNLAAESWTRHLRQLRYPQLYFGYTSPRLVADNLQTVLPQVADIPGYNEWLLRFESAVEDSITSGIERIQYSTTHLHPMLDAAKPPLRSQGGMPMWLASHEWVSAREDGLVWSDRAMKIVSAFRRELAGMVPDTDRAAVNRAFEDGQQTRERMTR